MIIKKLVSMILLATSINILNATQIASATNHRSPHHVTWKSGASGTGVTDGSFGVWRNRKVDIAGTWNDSIDAQTAEYTVTGDGEYSDWTKDLDVAIGAIYENQGETWAAAATGAYDQRWRTALQTLAAARNNATGTTYIRFAHEFNGEWEPWKVTGNDVHFFKKAWKRFRTIQLQVFPTAKLVYCPSIQTSSSLDLDWRKSFPGHKWVDILGVDYYNQYPFITTGKQFRETINRKDQFGAPSGIETYRKYALKHHMTMAIPEWSTNADMGDSPIFLKNFHQWLQQHGGHKPGQIAYEILFNVDGFQNNQFELYPTTRQPETARLYKEFW